MPLAYDRPDVQPGMHALIVGVSRYPYLMDAERLETERDLGVHSLTSAASSAFALFSWLKQRAQPPVPLASIRLMIAPSEEELAKTPELGQHALACSVSDFTEEVYEWRSQAASSEKGMTLFYFAGNGVQRTKEDVLLLFSDFGRREAPLLASAVSLFEIFEGMFSPDEYPKLALTQLYFIDTGPSPPGDFYRRSVPRPVFDLLVNKGPDTRSASIFQAAPGTAAFAQVGNRSLFVETLLRGLQGAAGQELEINESTQTRWGVTVHSLARYLTDEGQKMTDATGQPVAFQFGGLFRGDAIIQQLDRPPAVTLDIKFDPPLDVGGSCEILDLDGRSVAVVRGPSPSPMTVEIPAGAYVVQISGPWTARRFFSARGPRTTVLIGPSTT
jgi:hypothetical protein